MTYRYRAVIGDDLSSVRATRARPRQLAGVDPQRRGVYDAALEQFEQLLRAAETVGAASRPILLFYALSQAGTAILANRAEDSWQPTQHGVGFGEALEPVTLTTAVPKADGRFGKLAAVLGCTGFTGEVPLGAAWRANPDLLPVRFPGAAQWPRPLSAELRNLLGATSQDPVPENELQIVVNLPSDTSQDQASELLSRYPRLAGRQPEPWGRRGVRLRFPTQKDESGLFARPMFSDVTSTRVDRDLEQPWQAYAVPALTPGAAATPILLWWIVLFILSNLARYEPALWRQATDPSSSTLAVPLERVMESALACLPSRVLRELTPLPIEPWCAPSAHHAPS